MPNLPVEQGRAKQQVKPLPEVETSQEFQDATTDFERQTRQQVENTKEILSTLRSSLESGENQPQRALLLVLNALEDKISDKDKIGIMKQSSEAGNLTGVLDLFDPYVLKESEREVR